MKGLTQLGRLSRSVTNLELLVETCIEKNIFKSSGNQINNARIRRKHPGLTPVVLSRAHPRFASDGWMRMWKQSQLHVAFALRWINNLPEVKGRKWLLELNRTSSRWQECEQLTGMYRNKLADIIMCSSSWAQFSLSENVLARLEIRISGIVQPRPE